MATRKPALSDDRPVAAQRQQSPVAWALRYARGGLPVLPLHTPSRDGCSCGNPRCTSQGKHPRTAHGKDDATTDLATIEQWWRRWPDANVGVRPPVGIVVLDVDPRHGGDVALAELEARHGRLPDTLTARTGGGGWHYWYAYGGRAKGTLCPGVDVKTHSGYLVASPSIHSSGRRYEWYREMRTVPAPGWVRQLLDPPISNVIPLRRAGSVATTAGLVRVVALAPQGERNRRLYWAACRAYERGGHSAVLAELRAAAAEVGLTDTEIDRTVDSARRAQRRQA
jgi:hypothetical protein